jgi:hypothetical protein
LENLGFLIAGTVLTALTTSNLLQIQGLNCGADIGFICNMSLPSSSI